MHYPAHCALFAARCLAARCLAARCTLSAARCALCTVCAMRGTCHSTTTTWLAASSSSTEYCSSTRRTTPPPVSTPTEWHSSALVSPACVHHQPSARRAYSRQASMMPSTCIAHAWHTAWHTVRACACSSCSRKARTTSGGRCHRHRCCHRVPAARALSEPSPLSAASLRPGPTDGCSAPGLGKGAGGSGNRGGG